MENREWRMVAPFGFAAFPQMRKNAEFGGRGKWKVKDGEDVLAFSAGEKNILGLENPEKIFTIFTAAVLAGWQPAPRSKNGQNMVFMRRK